MMIAVCIFSFGLLLLLAAFLSAAEAAFEAASRSKMATLEKEGDRRAGEVARLLSDRDTLFGVLGLSRIAAKTLAIILSVLLAVTLIGQGWAAMLAASVGATLLILIFAEIMPRAYAGSRPDSLALWVAAPVGMLVRAIGWLLKLVNAVAFGLLRLAGARQLSNPHSAGEEIRDAIDQHAAEGGVDRQDHLRLVGALELRDLTVEDVMIHRKNIQMFDADLEPRQLIMKALASPHTRLPLYRGEKEEIVGILHAKDLLRAALPLAGDLSGFEIGPLLRDPWFVPETTPVQDQLSQFLARGQQFALVIDEYGELQGLITLEDILEEIVGAIHDEYDVQIQGVRPQPDGSVNVDGWVPIRDLNRATGWELPDEEAVTVAGLVIHEAQTIPEPGQSFVFHGYRFNILRRQRNQVTGVNVSKVEIAAGI